MVGRQPADDAGPSPAERVRSCASVRKKSGQSGERAAQRGHRGDHRNSGNWATMFTARHVVEPVLDQHRRGHCCCRQKPSSQQAAASPEAEPHAGLLDVRSRITTDITKIDQHPTDAWTSRPPPGALIAGPDKTSGLSNRWCASDEVHSAATVGVTLTQRDGAKG